MTDSMDLINLGDVIRRAHDEAFRERGLVNILIGGRTGVGKSTLVNAVFQRDLAETGQGRPVTKHTKAITKDGSPLTLFDTRGLEMADFRETLSQLEQVVADARKGADPSRHIHAAWVCLTEDSRRVETAESQLVDMLAAHVPVIVVITKARADQGFRATVWDLVPQARNVVRVRALQETLDDGYVLPSLGLDQLVEVTNEVVPDGQRQAFAAAQRVSTRLKADRAQVAVGVAAAAAAAVGAMPIPVADAILLIPIQVKMLATITTTFGVPATMGFLNTLMAGALGISGATVAGRTIVGNLLKLLPGVGTAIGGMITGSTAAVLTTVLGEAYIATLTRLFDQNQGEPPTPDAIVRTLKEELTRRT